MPHPSPDDWPRRCSRTTCASLEASSSPPLARLDFVCQSERKRGICFDLYFVVSFLPIAVAINGRLFLFYRHLRRMIGLSIGWKRPPAHIFAIFLRGLRDDFPDVGILARKFRRLSKRKAQKIVNDENLPIAVRAGADADRRDAQFARNLRRQLARHRLQNNRKSPRRFHRARISNQLPGSIRCFSLHAISAQRIHRLRRQADVPRPPLSRPPRRLPLRNASHCAAIPPCPCDSCRKACPPQEARGEFRG